MSALDRNKIFFGLIHYILSEQSNVDWILKTSLVNFTGINSTVDNKKYKQNSVTEDIIEYIYQVKPYHVTFEQFIEKYSSKQDEVNVSSQEQNNITMYIRYDSITSEVDAQGDMTDYEYMDTHMANRLWYFKHADFKNIYGNDEEIHKYIKDVMNCHFKGVTVEGGDFNLDKSGYDAFLYDSTLYDAPTLTSDYCLINYKEDLQYPYVKNFVKVGLKSFKLDYKEDLRPSNISVYSIYNGEKTDIENFTLENNLISFFTPIRNLEKIIIVNKVKGIRNGYVFVGHSFIESEDESNLRKFVEVGTNRFPIPDGNLGSKKVTVHIELPNGSRYPSTNYEKFDGDIIIYDKLEENYHVVLTVIDYKQIYDKIYTYEDCYGQSNNVITLDGDKFLRPYYEKERPSELCVSYPIHNLMIYTENTNGKVKSLYSADFKSMQYKLPITQTLVTKLSQDLNIGDRIIEVDNLSKVILPSIGSNNQVVPGRIIINSEIIEFYEYEKGDGQKGILKSIRRGAKGSYLAEKHLKGSTVYTYNEQALVDCSSSSVNFSTYITDKTENKFLIPGVLRESDKIAVFKKPYINLLSDITFIGKSFDISSDNVVKPGEVTILSELNFTKVHRGQILGIVLGSSRYEIDIKEDCNIDQFIKIVIGEIPSAVGFNITNKDNKLEFVASDGKPIKIYNVEGYALQEAFGNVTIGTKQNPIIKLDGYNGLIINNYEILWGNDTRSVQWMQDNPSVGTVDDAVSTINSAEAVNKIIKAYNRNGCIELVSLVNEEVEIKNLTNLGKPFNNITELGIKTIISTQSILLNTNGQLNYYGDVPSKLGNIFINDEKLYFKNIQEIVNGKNITYRISNYFTDKEYKKGEAVIIAVKPEEVKSSEYVINYDDETISFNEAPKVGEVITISNEK